MSRESGIDLHFNVVVDVQERHRSDNQYANIDVFRWPTDSRAQCENGTEKYADASINCDNQVETFSQSYGEIVPRFRHLTRYNIL